MFKVGDKVKIIDYGGDYAIEDKYDIGDIETIETIDGLSYQITCKGDDDNCWWVRASMIEKIMSFRGYAVFKGNGEPWVQEEVDSVVTKTYGFPRTLHIPHDKRGRKYIYDAMSINDYMSTWDRQLVKECIEIELKDFLCLK